MSTLFGSQLEPFEENQSPSPQETTDNPYETSLAPRSSSLHQRKGSGPPSPINTVNTLHRQLSGDPETSPPPAWKRRSSVSSKHAKSPSAGSVQPQTQSSSQPQTPASPAAAHAPASSNRSVRSPSASSVHSRNSLHTTPSSRRHPGLVMTTATAANGSSRSPSTVPNGMFLHESPNGSSTSLNDPNLALPNPAFRRRAADTNSNRSSVASSQDLTSLTSEELWALSHDQELPDMSNPSRQAAERPLDTVRRMSKRLDRSDQAYYGGLPGEVIWPSAPPVEEILPDSTKSKSFTNVTSLGMTNRRASKRGRSRRSSVEILPAIVAKDNGGIYMHGNSAPGSPAQGKGVNGAISSAHSSSTSLASQGVVTNKSFSSLSRPPSTYYSRDFLSSLAPREGGYAIAAQMGGGLGAHGTMSVEEKRRNSVLDDPRSKSMGSRAPLSKSAGMGRWSLDGGENYGRPYTTPSAATTSSNLTGPPINSAEPSPSPEEITPTLPEGASPAFTTPQTAAPVSASPTAPAVSTTPPNRSPLSQQTSAEDVVPTPTSAIPPPPIPASNVAPPPALNTKKSKKQLAKEVKAAEKAEAVKVARARAEAARAEALTKQQIKEETKRKEKEEKARRKAEKQAAKNKKPTPVPQPVPVAKAPAPKAATPTPTATASTSATTTIPGAQPFPRPLQSSQSAYKVPTRDASVPPRQTHRSMPLNSIAPAPTSKPGPGPGPATAPPASGSRPPSQPKRSFLGTIRKRLSYIAGSAETKAAQQNDAPPPVPKIDQQKVSGAQTQRSPIAQQHPSPQPQSEQPQSSAERPPRRDSLLASPGVPKVVAPVQPETSDMQTEIRGEATNRPEDVLAAAPLAPGSPSAAPVLAQPVDHAASSPRTGSPASSPRKRNSLVGPRPMPESKSRPSSITASSSDHAQNQAPSQSLSYPFPTEGSAVPVTPSTSGDSTSYVQSQGSYNTGVTSITSPSNTDVESRKSMDGEVSLEDGPVRMGSKDSNETVHVDKGAVHPAQPVFAA